MTRWLAALALLTCGSALAAETLVKKLLRIGGLTASAGQVRAPGDVMDSGDIWVASLGGRSTPLTSGGGYRSPVFSPADGSIFALKGESVVRRPSEGKGEELVGKVPRALKLVGVDPSNRAELVVLVDAQSPLGVLSLMSGKITPLPWDAKSTEQRQLLAQIRGQTRNYGDVQLYVKTETKQGLSRTIEWTDVYLRRGEGPPQNISMCDAVNCGQPALSPDGRRVAFVRSGG